MSSSYSHEKLENPSLDDLLDVFEDLWRHCFFAPVDLLLKTPSGDIAAMTVLCSYFEAIGGYISGENTNGRTKEFFVKSFCLVFCSNSPEIHKAAEAIYKHIRCGLAHEGMLSHKVNYSRAGAKAFFLTYHKMPDTSLDIAAGVASIIVNPLRMYYGVLHHFDGYVRALRDGKDEVLVKAFQKTVERQWALGTSENIIGMTEAEFLGRA
ncbi:hypothetical protein [Laribacter hongkongensis]|uniref:hypothetical protein n=1 Tax=Laribacter hongkongensis TaxID=168471 RepID=UPI0012DDF4FE|nr:hypothetical protein [Laribacter hongkongensis]